MQSQEESLRHQIALGWVLELLVVLLMLLFMVYDSVFMNNNFRALFRDPGTMGIKMLTYVLGFYALMPVFVHLVHGLRTRIGRWFAAGAATLGFFYFLLHHLGHMQFGDRPNFTSHVFDLILHAIALWVIINSVKWAKLPPTNA